MTITPVQFFICDAETLRMDFKKHNLKLVSVNTSKLFGPHQWWSGSALTVGRQDVPGSITGRACRPSRSEFSVVFF